MNIRENGSLWLLNRRSNELVLLEYSVDSSTYIVEKKWLGTTEGKEV